jgi:hypothetical protein
MYPPLLLDSPLQPQLEQPPLQSHCGQCPHSQFATGES